MVRPLEQHLSPTPGNLSEMQNLCHFPDQLLRNRFHKGLGLETTVLVLGDPRASPQAHGSCTGYSLAPGSTFFPSRLPLTRCVPDADLAAVGCPCPCDPGPRAPSSSLLPSAFPTLPGTCCPASFSTLSQFFSTPPLPATGASAGHTR